MDSDPIHPDSDVSPKFVVKSQRNAWAAWAAQAGVLPLPLPSLLRALTDGNEDAEMCSFDFFCVQKIQVIVFFLESILRPGRSGFGIAVPPPMS